VFFEEPQLSLLIKIFGLNLIIISLSIVQQTQLSKRLDFKLQTKFTAFSAVVSGIVGITLAYCGFGVWSLIYKSVIEYSLRSVLLWFMNNWKPSFVFSKKSFSELFGFGFKLMLRGLIYSVFNNIYYAVIGKYYSTAELGYYTRAEQFSNLPSHNINKVVDRVTYPALSVLQNDKKELKRAYRKVFLTLVYITSTLMITLGALAEPVILSLIGEKWENSIEMLQYLCFIGLLYPLCDFNLTILKIVGKSSTILWLEIIKRLFTIPVIIVGVLLGIKFLLIGIIIVSVIEFLVNGFFSGRYIDYPIQEQLKDNMANIFLAIFLGVAVYSFSYLIGFSPVLNLVLSGVFAILIVLFCSELFKIQGYINIKEIVKERFGKSRNSK
jgi:O-antigen/teichoic acid export membrane protein